MQQGLCVPYDAAYSPPAPVVTVTLQSPADPSLTVSVQALMDTGSDITAVPDWLPAQLRLRFIRDAFIAGFDGTHHLSLVYRLHLTIGRLQLQNVRVVTLPVTEFLLCRNVLNSFDLRLNGPQLITEILNA